VSLGKERRSFSRRIALLYHYLEFLGIDYAKDQGKRCKECPVGHTRSTHKVGLAEDILFYGPNGEYPHPDAHNLYVKAHDFWDVIGGAPRIENDLNHFSNEWNGVR